MSCIYYITQHNIIIINQIAGTSSRIALLSLQADNIAYASLAFISSDGNRARRINLIKCKTTRLFVSDVVTFSEGTYDVELSGHDIHGVSFTQSTEHTLTFDSSNTVDYDLTPLGEGTLEMKRNDFCLSLAQSKCVLHQLPLC